MSKVRVSLGVLKELCKKIKKDHGKDICCDDSTMIEICTDDLNMITFHGTYDCPPIPFHYRYGYMTGFKVEKLI